MSGPTDAEIEAWAIELYGATNVGSAMRQAFMRGARQVREQMQQAGQPESRWERWYHNLRQDYNEVYDDRGRLREKIAELEQQQASGAVDLGDPHAEYLAWVDSEFPNPDDATQHERAMAKLGFLGAYERIDAKLHPAPPETDPFEAWWETAGIWPTADNRRTASLAFEAGKAAKES